MLSCGLVVFGYGLTSLFYADVAGLLVRVVLFVVALVVGFDSLGFTM